MAVAEYRQGDAVAEVGATIAAVAVAANLKGLPLALAKNQPSPAALNAQSAALSTLNTATNTLAQTLGPAASIGLIGVGLRMIASGI